MSTKLEISPELYAEISDNLRGAQAVAMAVKSIISPHLSARLESCLARVQGAIGCFLIVPSGQPAPAGSCPDGEIRP